MVKVELKLDFILLQVHYDIIFQNMSLLILNLSQDKIVQELWDLINSSERITETSESYSTVIPWCFWLVTFLPKLNKTPTAKTLSSPLKMTGLRFPTWALTSVKRKGSLKHLCYLKHDFSSPSSKNLHSTHSYFQHPDCFHIHAGNSHIFFLGHVDRVLALQLK